jgi:streptogramin lyase
MALLYDFSLRAVFLKNGSVTNYGGEIASSTGGVRNFVQGSDGVVWAATTSGLWRFDHSHWEHIGSESNVPSGPVAEVRFDQEGTLWALAGIGYPGVLVKLIYLRPGSRHFQTAGNELDVRYFTLATDGTVVTSPKSKFLDDSSGNSGEHPHAYPVLRKESAQIVDRTEGVWIIPKDPVLLRLPAAERLSNTLHGGSPRNSETYNVNSNEFAKLVDREGDIWFGDQKGIHRFFYSPLVGQKLPNNVTASPYFIVAPDDNGAVWITAGNFGSVCNLLSCRERSGQIPEPTGLIVGVHIPWFRQDILVWRGCRSVALGQWQFGSS